MQLKETYNGLNGLNEITERKSSRGLLIVGKQGMVKYNYGGKCNTKACKCRKNGQISNSGYHRGNKHCKNKD